MPLDGEIMPFGSRFTRGVHGSGWVGLRGFFDPTCHGGSKKNSTQPNLTHMGRVESIGLSNYYYYY